MKPRYTYQILELIESAKGRSEKLKLIKLYANPGLINILRLNFDTSISFDINLDVEFRPLPKRFDELSVAQSSRLWWGLRKESRLTQQAKQRKLISMLERMEPNDAKAFIQAAKHKLNVGLTAKTLQKAFPEYFATLK